MLAPALFSVFCTVNYIFRGYTRECVCWEGSDAAATGGNMSSLNLKKVLYFKQLHGMNNMRI